MAKKKQKAARPARKIDYDSGVNQNIKGQLVQREVLSNVNPMINMLQDAEKITWDNWENLTHDPEQYKDYGYESPVAFQDSDSFYQEIFEYWLVTKWLYEKLKALGEPVLSIDDYNHVWGRTTTGQAISMDGVINQIAVDMEILDGMKNSWSRYHPVIRVS